jgi:hypothetical protein
MQSSCLAYGRHGYVPARRRCTFNRLHGLTSENIELFINIRRGADKSLAFPICSTTKKFFLDGLKKLE